MILKFFRRDASRSGWVYVDGVVRIETVGPITDAEGAHRAFRGHADVVDFAKSYWGEDAGGDLPQHFAFVDWPVFTLALEGGLGGSDDAYTLVQVTVHLSDERIGLVYLTQDDAFLLGDDGKTIDRLR